jgi:hypothetical protein
VKIVTVSFMFCDTLDACRAKVIDAVERAWPSQSAQETVEVDVIGLSMGGVVGRYCAVDAIPGAAAGAAFPLARTTTASAAMRSAATTAMTTRSDVTTRTTTSRAASAGRRLRIARLFTISSPHLGSVQAAALPRVTQIQEDLRPGSVFLTRLAQEERDEHDERVAYEIVPYVRLGDGVVGPQYAAPAGQIAWWAPNMGVEAAHIGAMSDPRILADIMRRLRGEIPLTKAPPAPLPAAPPPVGPKPAGL